MTPMTDLDLRALLGDYYDDADEDTRQVIVDAEMAIRHRWPHPDDAQQRQDALSAALEIACDGVSDADAASAYLQARAAEIAAQARMTGAIIAHRLMSGATDATRESEVAISSRLGITRMTVRKALGKGKRK